MNKYDLYTLCAQNPARDARALHAIFRAGATVRRAALTLGEDFSAAAALSRAWCRAYSTSRAVAVDKDPEVLAHAKPHPRVRLVCADVLNVDAEADLIAVLNFSICEIHRRPDLVAYLRHARSRLRPKGCLICDLYAGADAFQTGVIRQRVVAPDGRSITYQWEQRTADPLTGRVSNAMHFFFSAPKPKPAGSRRSPTRSRAGAQHLRDAFVYDWRLWGVPELTEAMREAGFTHVEIYPRTADAIDHTGELYFSPILSPSEVGDSFNIFLAART